MRFVYILITFVIIALGISVAHIGMASFLKYPYNSLNILFIFFTLYILKKEGGLVVWLAFVTHFIIELYTTFPFGITLFSATIAVLLGFWLFQRLFTNRSWYTAPALCLCMLLFYRILYCLLIVGVATTNNTAVGFTHLLVRFAWELFLSTAAVTIIFPFIAQIGRSNKPTIFMRV